MTGRRRKPSPGSVQPPRLRSVNPAVMDFTLHVAHLYCTPHHAERDGLEPAGSELGRRRIGIERPPHETIRPLSDSKNTLVKSRALRKRKAERVGSEVPRPHLV